MDYKKRIKDEMAIIDEIVHNRDNEALVIIAVPKEGHSTHYFCASMDNLIKMLCVSALANEEVDFAIRTAIQAVDSYRKDKYGNENNTSLN